jgi:hypothetical protein
MPGVDVGVDLDTITPVVQAALGSRRARVATWSLEPILGGLDRASRVDRVIGTVRVGATLRS